LFQKALQKYRLLLLVEVAAEAQGQLRQVAVVALRGLTTSQLLRVKVLRLPWALEGTQGQAQLGAQAVAAVPAL
jgi:hypothetical protein